MRLIGDDNSAGRGANLSIWIEERYFKFPTIQAKIGIDKKICDMDSIYQDSLWKALSKDFCTLKTTSISTKKYSCAGKLSEQYYGYVN